MKKTTKKRKKGRPSIDLAPMVRLYDDALSPELCDEILARFEKDKRVAPDPQPDYSTRKFLSVSQYPDWMSLNAKLCLVVNDLVGDYFARPDHLAAATHQEWSDDGYIVSRYDVGDTCIMHVDGQCAFYPQNGLRLATLLFYLNDVESGGETWFPLQDLKVAPKRGRAVMFPVGFTHPHEVLAAQSTRYIMQTWITDPNLVVMERAEFEDAFLGDGSEEAE